MIVHFVPAPAPIVAPVKCKVVAPVLGVKLPDPQPVRVAPVGLATVTFCGKASVRFTDVN